MLRAIILPAAVLAATTAAVAQRPDTDFSPDRIKAHVAFLADDLLEGREAGTRGHEIAARYIASQLALLGVKPGGDNGSYFQSVHFIEAAPTGPKPTLVLTTAKGAQTLIHGGNAVITGAIAEGPTRLGGPLVFVGFGMKDPVLGYDDYAGLDVRGKIAVVLWGSPKGMDSEIGAHLQSLQKQIASEHGALAVIAIPTRASAGAIPWEQMRRFGESPLTTWVDKDGSPFDSSHGLKASAWVEQKAAAALFVGTGRTLTQLLDEADKPGGRPKGFALKAKADLTLSATLRKFSSPEVVGIVEGSDPVLKNDYVVLMAHADHIGMKHAGAGDRINNGALDNAAGIATLLEVARALTATANRPRRSILLVANTAEEKGLLGAEYFAHNPSVAIDRVTAAIDLDMPMLLYDFTDVVAYGAGHSNLQAVFEKASAEMGVMLSPDPMPEQAVFVRSDHYPMVKAGVPAVVLATGMANGGQEAWGKFLSTNYHQPSDDLSQPIVWGAGAKFAELNYRVVRALANADSRAQWYEKDYFGDLFAPKAAKVAKPGKP